jgi:hypothetical protein
MVQDAEFTNDVEFTIAEGEFVPVAVTQLIFGNTEVMTDLSKFRHRLDSHEPHFRPTSEQVTNGPPGTGADIEQ